MLLLRTLNGLVSYVRSCQLLPWEFCFCRTLLQSPPHNEVCLSPHGSYLPPLRIGVVVFVCWQ